MINELLKNYHIVLASGSPRRQRFFKLLEIDFEIDVRKVEEVFDPTLKAAEITDYLAQLKASAFQNIPEKTIVITSDTIVWFQDRAIGKPKNKQEAIAMLQELSDNMHEVYTSVCFTMADRQITVNDRTAVWFKKLNLQEIEYYIDQHQPFDKAGSYGIQDWLGYIGIERIEGCFFNVMGLPTRLVYKTLMEIAQD